MVIKLLGIHNETLLRIDTGAYEHCAGIFIETPPADGARDHFVSAGPRNGHLLASRRYRGVSGGETAGAQVCCDADIG